MSLVNDALRRAKEAQQNTPAPSAPPMHFRPIEPRPHARQNLGLMVPVLLAMLALLALFALWQWVQGRAAAQARALTPAPAPAVAAAQPIAAAQSATPAPVPAPLVTQIQKPAIQPAPVASASASTAATSPVDPNAAALAANHTNEVTNAAALTVPAVVKPPALRLQAIVYNPKRPSALISGKTVFIGEKVGDARVVAIDQESATLVSGGKTNVLSLLE